MEDTFKVPNIFIKQYNNLGISFKEAMFIIHVHLFKNQEKIKVETIANRMNKSQGTVRYYIRSLRKKGFLITSMKLYGQCYDFTPLYEALKLAGDKNEY